MSSARSILFVDDYDMLRQIYGEILSTAGYRVMQAADVNECMQSLAHDVPDLILLDIMMKPIDGWETLRQIRSFTPTSDIPVIMISGKAILSSEVSIYGPLIDGFLRKPLLNAVLVSNIREFFTWFEALKNQCREARSQGVDETIVSSFFSLKRQERSMSIMLRMIQKEYDSGGDQRAYTIINDDIQEIKNSIQDITSRIQECEQAMGVITEVTR